MLALGLMTFSYHSKTKSFKRVIFKKKISTFLHSTVQSKIIQIMKNTKFIYTLELKEKFYINI